MDNVHVGIFLPGASSGEVLMSAESVLPNDIIDQHILPLLRVSAPSGYHVVPRLSRFWRDKDWSKMKHVRQNTQGFLSWGKVCAWTDDPIYFRRELAEMIAFDTARYAPSCKADEDCFFYDENIYHHLLGATLDRLTLKIVCETWAHAVKHLARAVGVFRDTGVCFLQSNGLLKTRWSPLPTEMPPMVRRRTKLGRVYVPDLSSYYHPHADSPISSLKCIIVVSIANEQAAKLVLHWLMQCGY
jgi:hypothetical protein